MDAVFAVGDARRQRALYTAVRLVLDASELPGDLATEALAALAALSGGVELRARLAEIEREADT